MGREGLERKTTKNVGKERHRKRRDKKRVNDSDPVRQRKRKAVTKKKNPDTLLTFVNCV